jgi:3-oxoisoapionate decarboxylase
VKLGISTWSVPWSVGVSGYPPPEPGLDALGLISKAADLGVEVVQIADNLPLHTLPEDELARIRAAAATKSLALEVGTRGLEYDHLVRYIGIADQLGARALRTVLSGAMLGRDEMASAEEAIRRVVSELEGHRVTLALENNEAFSAEQFSELMRSISSPHVGICLDTANSLGRPDPLPIVVHHLAPYTVMLHAKDYDIKRVSTRMGFSVVGRPAGQGRVDFDAVLAELRQQGRNDISVIIEHWPPFEDDIEATVQLEEMWLGQSVEFLRPRVAA